MGSSFMLRLCGLIIHASIDSMRSRTRLPPLCIIISYHAQAALSLVSCRFAFFARSIGGNIFVRLTLEESHPSPPRTCSLRGFFCFVLCLCLFCFVFSSVFPCPMLLPHPQTDELDMAVAKRAAIRCVSLRNEHFANQRPLQKGPWNDLEPQRYRSGPNFAFFCAGPAGESPGLNGRERGQSQAQLARIPLWLGGSSLATSKRTRPGPPGLPRMCLLLGVCAQQAHPAVAICSINVASFGRALHASHESSEPINRSYHCSRCYNEWLYKVEKGCAAAIAVTAHGAFPAVPKAVGSGWSRKGTSERSRKWTHRNSPHPAGSSCDKHSL